MTKIKNPSKKIHARYAHLVQMVLVNFPAISVEAAALAVVDHYKPAEGWLDEVELVKAYNNGLVEDSLQRSFA